MVASSIEFNGVSWLSKDGSGSGKFSVDGSDVALSPSNLFRDRNYGPCVVFRTEL